MALCRPTEGRQECGHLGVLPCCAVYVTPACQESLGLGLGMSVLSLGQPSPVAKLWNQETFCKKDREV